MSLDPGMRCHLYTTVCQSDVEVEKQSVWITLHRPFIKTETCTCPYILHFSLNQETGTHCVYLYIVYNK